MQSGTSQHSLSVAASRFAKTSLRIIERVFMPRFTDKSILITGAGSGIGRATAIRLATEDAGLTLVDLNSDGLAETSEQILLVNPNAELNLVTADVTDENAVQRFVASAVNKFGKIDGFFNNAGIASKQAPIEDYSLAQFQKVLGVNLSGVFLGLEHVLRQMREQGSGAIVNTASVGGIRGVTNQSGYVAAKHGVVGLTRAATNEYGQYGIRINAIAPGRILTPMIEDSLRQANPEDPEGALKKHAVANPMRRFGQPEEIAAVVAFLLSDDASYMNATVVPIDGGQSAMY